MDIKRQKKKPIWMRKVFQMAFLIFSLMLLLAAQTIFSDEGPEVSMKDIWLGTAKTGTLKIEVEGFGKLKSKYQRLLTAPSNGIVEEIILKPGAEVAADDVIIRLLNPDLDQAALNEQLLLNSAQANLRQIIVNNKRELLAQQAHITELEAQLGVADFNLEATRELAEKGIVSKLDHKRAELESTQLQKRLHIEFQRLEQLKTVHEESINIQKEKIDQQASKLNAIEVKQSKLVIRANIPGVLQKLDVELGQSVSVGDTLAFVGGTEQLIAEIKVPQNQVDQIEIGQAVDINTRQDVSAGKVARIDPVVTDGTVFVDVDLLGALPNGARPDLSVDATVKAGEVQNVVFIERPVNVMPGTTATLFKVTAGNDEARSVQVTFGQEAGKFIQILEGASDGERFILSDTSQWQQLDMVLIK